MKILDQIADSRDTVVTSGRVSPRAAMPSRSRSDGSIDMTQMEDLIEPLSYWIRLEDIASAPGIDDCLIEQAGLGLLLVQTERDLASWVAESQALIDRVDADLHRAAGGVDDVVSIGRAAPPMVLLRSLLGALTPSSVPTDLQPEVCSVGDGRHPVEHQGVPFGAGIRDRWAPGHSSP